MNIIGKWKIKEFRIPTPDGRMDTLMPVPEEMLEQVQSEGMEIRDGFAVIKSAAWKEQDGRFFFDSGIEGEILGETVDPFMEIKVLPDGCLLYNMDVLVLEKA